MNALEAASLVMIPSGYENGTLGSLKPTDGTGDFTFSRGSDISATRVNEDGNIEKGYENLLYPSNDFSGWSKVELDLTPNQADPFGGNTATLITTTGTTFGWIRRNPTNTGVQTISFYAKAGSNTIFTASIIQAPYPQVKFTLTGDGSTSSNSVPIDSTITLIGDGWYRCSMTYNLTSTYEIRFYPNDTINETIGDSAYIYGFQLNQGLVAYPYVETTTAPVAGGILEDMPRLDYSGSCPALLLEPQRTNALSHSEYVSGINFSIGDFISSPEGVANGVGFIPSTSNTTHYISTAASGLTIANSSVVFSFYVKEGTQPYLRGRFDENSFTKRCFFGIDLTDNSVLKSGTGSSNVEITFEDSINGWKRVIFTATYDATPTGSGIAIFLGSGDQMGTDIDEYAGDGSTFFHIYGLQVEQGSYPTSYIPTYGTSQTRLGDLATDAGDANTFNSTEGVLYAELSFTNDNSFKSLSLNSGSSTNRVMLYSSNPSYIGVNIRNTSGNQFNGNFAIDSTINHKIAVKYKENDFALWIDGQERLSDLSGTTFPPSTLTQLDFDDANGNSPFNGVLKQIIVFPTALSDDECIELTTI